MTPAQLTRLAWEVEVNGMVCFVFATTKPKARWIAVKAYREAGFGGARHEWPSTVVRRASMYDNSHARDKPQQAWLESYL